MDNLIAACLAVLAFLLGAFVVGGLYQGHVDQITADRDQYLQGEQAAWKIVQNDQFWTQTPIDNNTSVIRLYKYPNDVGYVDIVTRPVQEMSWA